MHTSYSLKNSMFAVELEGQPSNRETLLDWQVHDRLGIVVTTPFGGLGASLLIQLATAAYYDARPARRRVPLYPELYLFHTGGRHGDFSNFDIAPLRKEIFLPADSGTLIEAINDRAITHLLVPDAEVREIVFPYKEVDATRERVRHSFAYDPSGRVANADVAIRALHADVAENIHSTLDPQRVLDQIPEALKFGPPRQREFTAKWAEVYRSRMNETTDADRVAARQRWDALFEDGLPRETYRRISINEALGKLHT